jgi:hypothetical protein
VRAGYTTVVLTKSPLVQLCATSVITVMSTPFPSTLPRELALAHRSAIHSCRVPCCGCACVCGGLCVCVCVCWAGVQT